MSTLEEPYREYGVWWKPTGNANGRWSWRYFFRANSFGFVREKRRSAIKMIPVGVMSKRCRHAASWKLGGTT